MFTTCRPMLFIDLLSVVTTLCYLFNIFFIISL